MSAILPAALLRGVGLGLAVTPLTAAVLDAVGDADLGEASAINDAASRVGGVLAVALVPVLIGVSAGAGLADALATGYEPAMIVIGGLCAAGALIALLFVSDKPRVAPRMAAPDRGCALPLLDPRNGHEPRRTNRRRARRHRRHRARDRAPRPCRGRRPHPHGPQRGPAG